MSRSSQMRQVNRQPQKRNEEHGLKTVLGSSIWQSIAVLVGIFIVVVPFFFPTPAQLRAFFRNVPNIFSVWHLVSLALSKGAATMIDAVIGVKNLPILSYQE